MCAKVNVLRQADELLKIATSARSCWGFMAVDMSLSKDERAAAKRAHDNASLIIAQAERT